MDFVSEELRRFVAAAAPEPTELQREMEEYGRDQGFPILGPAAGGLVMLLAELVDARRVFEFGSGFGYSASWFLRALPDDGAIVLTELDEDEADRGRAFLDRMDPAPRVTYEVGDALDVVEGYDGPFDVVLLDHQKRRYVEAFDAVAPKVAPGGVVVADNVLRGPFDFDDVLAAFEGGDVADASTRGVAEYVRHVRDAPGFTSAVLPVGNGIAVSHRDD